MKTTIDINAKIINAVYNDITRVYGISEQECYHYITNNANINKQSREEYILSYYENIILKNNENIILKNNKNNSVIIEDIDKVNFEELTETDKKVIASRKYVYHEYIKKIVYRLNELINSNLSNDRCAVDEIDVIMYAVQAIERDVANAVSDCQKVLKLMKSKCS